MHSAPRRHPRIIERLPRRNPSEGEVTFPIFVRQSGIRLISLLCPPNGEAEDDEKGHGLPTSRLRMRCDKSTRVYRLRIYADSSAAARRICISGRSVMHT